MGIKKSYIILGAILVVALVVGMFSNKKFNAEDKPLNSKNNVYQINLLTDWNVFKKGNKLSKNVKMENFAMTLDPKGGIVSVKFRLVEKDGNKYKVFNNETCVSCPNQKEQGTSIWKQEAREWSTYSELMTADKFFAKLQVINEQKLFTHDIQDSDISLFLVRSRGWSDQIEYPGKYYSIANDQISELAVPTSASPYKGYDLQVVKNNNGSTFVSDENTLNFIIEE